jgi:hypothetical protein
LTAAAIAVVVVVTRLLHAPVLWTEEAYPMAAAINIAAGRLPYRDFWFDKPPLTAWLYAAWGAASGVPLRLAGAAYLLLCCWLTYRLTRSLWAPALLAFFLVFTPPSAGLVLGPDLLTLAPVMAMVILRDRPLAAGAALGIAFQFNTKALFFLPLLAAASPHWMAGAGFLLIAAPVFLLPGYIEQVWRWGAIYASDTFVTDPLREGVIKSAGWLGFHAALALAALRARWDRTLWLWLAGALLCAAAGLRFFPRYYFHLLPPLVMAASAGLQGKGPAERAAWTRPQWRWLVVLALAVPLARYAPAYWQPARSRDLAMYRDARRAADLIREQALPTDTLFTWGYRPEVDAITRLPGATPYLESQPLTGVFADRHLRDAEPSAADAFTQEQRRRLSGTRPVWVVDGLGRYNPRLAIREYPDLREWLSHYSVAAITNGSIIYRRNQ